MVILQDKVTSRHVEKLTRPAQRPSGGADLRLQASSLAQQGGSGFALTPVDVFVQPLRRQHLPRAVPLHAMIVPPKVPIRGPVRRTAPEVHSTHMSERQAERMMPGMIVRSKISEKIPREGIHRMGIRTGRLVRR